jgi:AcrR family transcriptional regulator
MIIEIPSKGERTRQIIRETAYALILKQGYAATSMRQIAEQSGLALGSIYNHFSSKEAIFEDILVVYHPYHLIIPLLNSVPGDTPEDFIRNAARAMVDTLQDNPEFLNLMLIEFVEFKGVHTSRIFSFIFPQILQVVSRLDRFRGKMRPIPGPILMRAFISLFFAYFFTQIALGGDAPAELNHNSFESFVDIFLHGVLIPDA